MMPNTIPKMFLSVCDRFKGKKSKVAFSKKLNGTWVNTSHDELREQVECFAFGLLKYGIVPGDRVGIVSENRLEWVIADFAITAMGAVDVPIFPTLTNKQEAYIFNNCQATCVIVSNKNQLEKLLSVWDEIPSLKTIIMMNSDSELNSNIMTFESVIQAGKNSYSPIVRSEKFETMANHVNADDLLTIIYTSGTTGNPKGVMLSHSNITANISGVMEILAVDDTDVFLSYLPTCHSYERMGGYYLAFCRGASTFIAESIETVAENMREIRPTVMTSVPRLFERIQMRVLSAAKKESILKQKVFNWAFNVGRNYVNGKHGMLASFQYKLADSLVFSKIRARTGGRLRFFASGGAALNVSVGEFFKIIGITILEGYGLTESSPVLCVNRIGDEKLGTVGQPISNVELKIADDGEILARGPNIMMGYWKDEASTREAVTTDGWLLTGDIGEFDDRGRLKITDRKKHLLISSGGKNIAPLPIESVLTKSQLVDQAVLIGDRREFCTALLVVNADAVKDWYSGKGLSAPSLALAVRSDELRKAVELDLMQLQRELAKYERVRRFVLLSEPFTVENDMLTPTLKVRRKAVLERYSVQIEAMYK
ncbi:MAG: long-chain fatty acid--CoA ligase [Ignavibacteria bacterium]|nr:long-chain fatty acid--CoA ligase [Ignavibacteria bacterium]